MQRHGRLIVTLALALALASVAALAVACTPSSQAVRAPVLPFIEDDYAQALADARAKQLPIFVESWAPW